MALYNPKKGENNGKTPPTRHLNIDVTGFRFLRSKNLTKYTAPSLREITIYILYPIQESAKRSEPGTCSDSFCALALLHPAKAIIWSNLGWEGKGECGGGGRRHGRSGGSVCGYANDIVPQNFTRMAHTHTVIQTFTRENSTILLRQYPPHPQGNQRRLQLDTLSLSDMSHETRVNCQNLPEKMHMLSTKVTKAFMRSTPSATAVCGKKKNLRSLFSLL